MYTNEVKWLKFPVGFTSSPAVMTMRTAQRHGKPIYDQLLAVWLQLFDLAGRADEGGRLISNGIVMDERDIATAIVRRVETVNYCLAWYRQVGMIALDAATGAYAIPNWADMQSTEKMKKQRHMRREKSAP